jgi:hypothetical protein
VESFRRADGRKSFYHQNGWLDIRLRPAKGCNATSLISMTASKFPAAAKELNDWGDEPVGFGRELKTRTVWKA